MVLVAEEDLLQVQVASEVVHPHLVQATEAATVEV